MVFVCPTKDDAENITAVSAQVKEALQQLENQLNIGVKPICVPCCVPLCDYPPSTESKKHDPPPVTFDPPQVMVCYREPCKKSKGKQNGGDQEEEVIRLHQSKSRELRASILYTGCQCEKRDGLQDDCPRTGCHGSPECLTSPPTCGPSEFSNGKHLGKQKNKYGYLSKGTNGTKHGNGDSDGTKSQGAKYKCFAATVDQPIVIPMAANLPCCSPCPPC